MRFSDTALVIEGGGMRNSYTGAVVEKLMREGIEFGWVGGVSAGASHTANFLAGDPLRTRESFVSIGANPRTGGWGSFVRGRGYFDSNYIYHEAPLRTFEHSGGRIAAFDFPAFLRNPTPFSIGAFHVDTGSMTWWNRDHTSTIDALMLRVRASSTMPGFMIMPHVDGELYADGALGPSGGIPIDAAEAAGFRRFLVIMSRPRAYTKGKVTPAGILRRVFRTHPAIADALIARPDHYNATRARLLELERGGNAYLFFAKNMSVENRERNLHKLQESYRAGREQAEREWPAIREFLGEPD